jgi:hypothetical protein
VRRFTNNGVGFNSISHEASDAPRNLAFSPALSGSKTFHAGCICRHHCTGSGSWLLCYIASRVCISQGRTCIQVRTTNICGTPNQDAVCTGEMSPIYHQVSKLEVDRWMASEIIRGPICNLDANGSAGSRLWITDDCCRPAVALMFCPGIAGGFWDHVVVADHGWSWAN